MQIRTTSIVILMWTTGVMMINSKEDELNNSLQDMHIPMNIVQMLDIRKVLKLQAAQRILETITSVDSDLKPEFDAVLLPDVGCAVLSVTAKSLMSADMRLFYLASHLADGFTIEANDKNNVCFSLVFKDMFLLISCEEE